ncbi:MAG: Snf7 family protein [Nitrosopumilus sp.]|uniref:Snf7 family protein n=2 Tax=Candidatus Nitrosomaritimum aestuariumsis TaxID=3342354 RepID=A0AC60W8K8_9ARCH|nr:Snf7 family protein [Nitrosopumilaceae archaeon]MBA4462198.1 Snf7 family protein [Nitrosopumilaceae archaeon]MBA4463658.1 Snf7 family protein [Nitrosopumilaceae archaeon]
MISNSWNKASGESLSQKVMGKVRPDEPLKNKIEFAQRKLQSQITKLDGINIKLQRKHDSIFEKIVNAQKTHNNGYAKAYANELAQVRKMKNMVSGAKLSMEQVQLRLSTVSELGDVVVTLSPAMSLIKGLSSSLSGIMPEANASMNDLSSILGDVLSGSAVTDAGIMDAGVSENPDTMAILEEAHSVIESQSKVSIPEVPDNLKHEIVQRRTAGTLI